MRYYPAFLDLAGKKVLVIGGGEVGERKTATLLSAGAQIRVVAPEISPRLREWAREGKIEYQPRPYDAAEIERDAGEYRVVMIATDDIQLNGRIAGRLHLTDCLVNVADQPELSNFIVPSIVSRGDLQIAVSTGGALPALSRKLRIDLEREFGEEYVRYLEILKTVREQLKRTKGSDERVGILYRLLESDLLNLVRMGKNKEIGKRIQELTGLEDLDLSSS